MSFIIGLLGMSKVGKDEVGKILIKEGFKRYAFGDEVKKELAQDLNIPLEDLHNQNKEKYRDKMIAYGEGKRKDNPSYWIERIDEQIQEDIKNNIDVVITDIRRIHEIDYIVNLKKVYGKNKVNLVRLSRPPGNGGVFDEDIETLRALAYADFHNYVDKKLYNISKPEILELNVGILLNNLLIYDN